MSQACFPSSEDEEAKELGRVLYFACGIIVFSYRTLRNGRVTANYDLEGIRMESFPDV